MLPDSGECTWVTCQNSGDDGTYLSQTIFADLGTGD